MNYLYQNIQRPTLTGIPHGATLVVPSDTADLPITAKGLRIVNVTTAFQSVTFLAGNGKPVTLLVPPKSLIFEDIIVGRVMATGTGTLTIHAYHD